MSLIEQNIPSLVGGVSQLPQAQRRNGEADAQINVLNHSKRGASKRPPLAHFAQLTTDVTGLDTGFTHEIALSTTETFLALVRDGVLEVYDKLTGDEVTVETVSADSYLTPVVEDEVVEDAFTEATDLVTMATHAISGRAETRRQRSAGVQTKISAGTTA